MLISQKMNAAINTQIGREYGAMLQYVAIASYFARESLPELAAAFHKQAEDERDHALRFVKYLVDTSARVEIPGINAPQSEFKGFAEAVALSLKWEQDVTRQINDLAELGIKESDHLTQTFLQWFINEQLEEITLMETLLRVVERAGPNNILMVEDFVLRHRSLGSGKGGDGGRAGKSKGRDKS